MKIYSASDAIIRGPADIEPDGYYGKGCFSNMMFHRGRVMQEALLHDPLAPKGEPHPTYVSRTIYKGQDVLDYIASYSDDALDVGFEIERQRKDDIRELNKRIDQEKKALREAHEEVLKKLGDTRKAILNLVQDTLDRSIDITKETKASCGVYFLRQGDEIVYVGQSISVYNRVNQHRSSKQFDSVTLLPCKPEQLNNLEGFFIRLLRPKLNGHNAVTGRHGAPSSWLWGDVVQLDASLMWDDTE